ncbi:MAG: ABC transporter permease, partial [Cellulomonas sp.]
MNWSETLATSWSAVRAHALRSLLTVLGILIGIAAVILTVGLGLGTQKDVAAQIDSLGSNLLIVSPGSSTDSSGMRGGFGTSTTLTQADAAALTSAVNAPDIAAVAPEKTTSLALEANDTNWTTSVTGTTVSWAQVRARELEVGEFFTQDDVDAAARVVVLGSETATELFGRTNVVGQTV